MSADLPEEVLNAPVRFWMCLNREHKNVTWESDVATCPDCGLTSEMTNRYATVLRIMLAEKIEALASAQRDIIDATPGAREGKTLPPGGPFIRAYAYDKAAKVIRGGA